MGRKYKFYDNDKRFDGGFVIIEEDWKYSRARNFCGSDSYKGKGLIELSHS